MAVYQLSQRDPEQSAPVVVNPSAGMLVDRRSFLKHGLAAPLVAGMSASWLAGCQNAKTATSRGPAPSISLAQWSLHRAFLEQGADPMEFPRLAMREHGLDAVEYVNVFYKDLVNKPGMWTELRKRCDDEGVTSVLIMCDGEGAIGDPDDAARQKTVDNHQKWLEGAKTLGCHAIRVNASSKGSYEEQQRLAADGLHRLCESADSLGLSVLVENHGGLSSNGQWLAGVMERCGHPRVGTLPDFGNFKITTTESYDRYQGVKELMPFARAVSAKSYDFDARGQETTLDYQRLIDIVLDAGYTGRIGVEYEGDRLSEPEGIRVTKSLVKQCIAAHRDRART